MTDTIKYAFWMDGETQAALDRLADAYKSVIGVRNESAVIRTLILKEDRAQREAEEKQPAKSSAKK